MRKLQLASITCLIAFTVSPLPASAFTQSGVGLGIGNLIPMGHEWVTRLAVLEVLGGDPIMPPDPNDPRRTWTQGLARNLNISSPGAQAEAARIRSLAWPDERYASTYKFIYDAILGERWVDLGGFNVVAGKIGKVDCWDAVAQEAVEVQYDHFMRRFDDTGGAGGVNATKQSYQRFIDYFVAAATAPTTTMNVWDGGGTSDRNEVDRNYFLLGRAAHLLQDSFSSEHTVRISADNYQQVRQVKSYLCAPGSEQHTHRETAIFDYTSGDVIWIPGTQLGSGWASYKPSNMKVTALVATEASKDLWAAFIRTMGTPPAQRAAVARSEAETLAHNWMSFDTAAMLKWYDATANRGATYVLAQGQAGPGQTVSDCMKGIGFASGTQQEAVKKFQAEQRLCLYNVIPEPGYADLYDTSMHMPFYWAWLDSTSFKQPPAGWSIPVRPADTGQRLRIRSAVNGLPMSAPDGWASDSLIYVRPNAPALDFIRVGTAADGYYRLVSAPELFLSYRAITGAVKLYDSPADANYRQSGQSIISLRWNQYMWLDGQSPYISGAGNPNNANAKWIVDLLP